MYLQGVWLRVGALKGMLRIILTTPFDRIWVKFYRCRFQVEFETVQIFVSNHNFKYSTKKERGK